jgi:integrase
VGEGIAESNPAIGTNKPSVGAPRERVLSDGEIAEIWAACRDDNPGRIVRLLLLTAARRNEVSNLVWDEVDIDAGTWTIPPARVKNGREHVLPLAGMALDLLKSIPRRVGRDFIFGEGEGGFSGWSKGKETIDARVMEARQKAHGKDAEAMPDWTLHDLRRSVATRMADLGIAPHIIETVLNHVSGHKAGVAGTYNRSTYAAEKAQALAIWSDHIRTIVEGGERKVIAFPTPA